MIRTITFTMVCVLFSGGAWAGSHKPHEVKPFKELKIARIRKSVSVKTVKPEDVPKETTTRKVVCLSCVPEGAHKRLVSWVGTTSGASVIGDVIDWGHGKDDGKLMASVSLWDSNCTEPNGYCFATQKVVFEPELVVRDLFNQGKSEAPTSGILPENLVDLNKLLKLNIGMYSSTTVTKEEHVVTDPQTGLTRTVPAEMEQGFLLTVEVVRNPNEDL